jgi:hypothetical protein
MRGPGRPLKDLPKKTIMNHIIRLRGRNNRHFGALWAEGLKTAKGRKAWKAIQENDTQITKWMSRI